MYFINMFTDLSLSSSTRCVGYYLNFDDAHDSVINNDCDIFEYFYTYCVIEKIDAGLYQHAYGKDKRWFYKINTETQKYEQMIVIGR
jgi:hypothetical protein